MIQITKEEAQIVREKLGDRAAIAQTCRQKKAKRRKYYMEENRASMKLLKQIRTKKANGGK